LPSSTQAARTAAGVFSQAVIFAQPEIPIKWERTFSISHDFSSGA